LLCPETNRLKDPGNQFWQKNPSRDFRIEFRDSLSALATRFASDPGRFFQIQSQQINGPRLMSANASAAMSEINDTGSTARVTRAIISVSDKTGLAEFGQALQSLGIEIYSTGGTARFLSESGVSVKDVAEYTRFPEMMDGRVKTLHPLIFGGILARRDNPQDQQSAEEHGILPFDLVVVNLYPFAETIARPNCSRESAIENIDIGGPSLVRAAAKNCKFVTIATSPEQYTDVVAELNDLGGTSQPLRNRLMAAAFQHTAEYDAMIATYFARDIDETADVNEAASSCLPESMQLTLQRKSVLRYGENSHQAAGFYEIEGDTGVSLVNAQQLNGKELSFNNLLDVNNGLTMVSSFAQPACVVIKHNNPCGAASGTATTTLADVFRRAFAGDPVSAFGSIVATNRPVDADTAEFLSQGDFFVEAIVCPRFAPEALEILKTKPRWKKNVRLLQLPLANAGQSSQRLDMRRVYGGMLVQQADNQVVDSNDWKVATEKPVDDSLYAELSFVWNMVRFVKSNAIVLGRDLALCGVGAGQMSRVDSVRIAIEKAGDRVQGSVLASDAFFPFPDSIELASKAGVAAVIQPGGSVKDPDVIQACNELGIPMILTGQRHFLH